jgi:hypothetical protein
VLPVAPLLSNPASTPTVADEEVQAPPVEQELAQSDAPVAPQDMQSRSPVVTVNLWEELRPDYADRVFRLCLALSSLLFTASLLLKARLIKSFLPLSDCLLLFSCRWYVISAVTCRGSGREVYVGISGRSRIEWDWCWIVTGRR